MKTCQIGACPLRADSNGMCVKHLARVRKTGSPYLGRALALKESFLQRISMPRRPDGCMIWTGAKGNHGYGIMPRMVSGQMGVMAHRFSYEYFVEPIPTGMEIDHLCRVPLCVAPTHLEPVTKAENCYRGISPAAVNHAKTHCIHGHEFISENMYIRPDNGGRQCKQCCRDRARRAKGS